jgi:hypothetical protein
MNVQYLKRHSRYYNLKTIHYATKEFAKNSLLDEFTTKRKKYLTMFGEK